MSQTTPDGASSAPPLPLLIERIGGVAVLTLNRPNQYNALNAALIAALHNAFDVLRDDDSVRVIVIAASGKAFCAGHDLKQMRSAGETDFAGEMFSNCSAMMQAIIHLSVPVIAEVNGMATAAGCQLVAQCDLAVAADHAKFAVSGVKLGLFCSTPAVPLSRAIARKRAAEMLLLGDFIDAQTALAWGLVNRVVTADILRATTLELCEKLTAKPRSTLATGKALFYRQLDMGLSAAYADASNTITCNFNAPDAQEGVAAFLEKRKPVW